MLSFLQFLDEARIDDQIVKNPSADALKNLAKRFHDKFSENVRYAIDKDGNTVAGRSGLFTHWDLADKGDPSELHHIEGGVHYHEGEYHFSAVDQHGTYYHEHGKYPTEHPIVKHLLRKGMKLNNELEP